MKITGIQQDKPSPENTDKGVSLGQPTNWNLKSPIGSNKQGKWQKTYSLPLSWTLPESMALPSILSLPSMHCIWSDRSYQARGGQVQVRKWGQCQNKTGYTYICITHTHTHSFLQIFKWLLPSMLASPLRSSPFHTT